MTSYLNRRAWILENDVLRVALLEEGGHIAAIVDKASGINPLWQPPWPSIEPSTFGGAHQALYGYWCGRPIAGGHHGPQLMSRIVRRSIRDGSRGGHARSRRSVSCPLSDRGLASCRDDERKVPAGRDCGSAAARAGWEMASGQGVCRKPEWNRLSNRLDPARDARPSVRGARSNGVSPISHAVEGDGPFGPADDLEAAPNSRGRSLH